MMCSRPSSHTMMGGNVGAVTFLQHFLDQLNLSENSSNLPLITAPVLVAFLTAAGHMLARKFPDEFRPLLKTVTDKVVPNVDKDTFGAPSATRLKKLVDGGFDGFEKTLPEGAVAELYSGAVQGQSTTAAAPSFSNTFVIGEKGAISKSQETSNGFNSSFSGSNQNSASSMASPFIKSDSTNSFGQSSGFGNSTQTSQSQTTFGDFNADINQDNQNSQSSVFGGFGSQSQNNSNSQQSSFGEFGGQTQSNSNSQQSFGGFGMNSTTNSNNMNQSNNDKPMCKFFAQGNCRYGDRCKFSHGNGNSSNQGQSTSFGSSYQGQNTPFVGTSQNQNTPFGKGSTSNQSSNPFGGSNQSQNTPFGGSSSNQNSNPFGGSMQNQNSTSFGGSSNTGQNATPFGGSVSGQNQTTPFGAPAQSTTPFGGTTTGQNANPFGGGGSAFGGFGQTAGGGNPFGKRF